MKAIIGGTTLLSSSLFEGWDQENIQTPYGDVEVRRTGSNVFLQRHGPNRIPPHAIDHRANIAALRTIGVTSVIGINSVGSLKIAIKPRQFVIPDDFMAPWIVPTFFDKEMNFTIPSMDAGLSAVLRGICEQQGRPYIWGGVYVQTAGPRFETRAEINFFRKYGDIVGMTMASEATLCSECHIPYASLCSVDNYANGIARKALTIEEVHETIGANLDAVEAIIRAVLDKGF